MQPFPPTLIQRHRKENLKKCSLKGLEKNAHFHFFTYPSDPLPDLTDYIVLALDAPLLTSSDSQKGLLIIDGTWRYTEKMAKQVDILYAQKPIMKRSLPPEMRTAYPRRQEDCVDPERGLASIEAIYIAHFLLRREIVGLLDNYYWKDLFLEKNKILLDFYR